MLEARLTTRQAVCNRFIHGQPLDESPASCDAKRGYPDAAGLCHIGLGVVKDGPEQPGGSHAVSSGLGGTQAGGVGRRRSAENHALLTKTTCALPNAPTCVAPNSTDSRFRALRERFLSADLTFRCLMTAVSGIGRTGDTNCQNLPQENSGERRKRNSTRTRIARHRHLRR